MTVSADKTTSPRGQSLFATANLLVLAAVLYGLSVRTNSPGAGLAVLVATTALGISILRSKTQSSLESRSAIEIPLLIVALGFGLLGVSGWAPSTIGPSSSALERIPGTAWASLAALILIARNRIDTRLIAVIATTATLLMTLAVGLIHLDRVDGVGLDVNLLHIAAAEAIANGDNPYTDAVVVPNGSPTAEPGDNIVGYPYPPITAVSYSVGQWVFDDPRFTSLICWLLVLALVGSYAIRRRTLAAVSVLLLLASVPGWPLVLRAGWTEPLSLLFLTVAFFLWRRPVGSGLSLGLGLASKQYFVVTAPVALLHRDERWLRRLLVAGTTVAVTIGAAVLLDFEAFWSAAVEFHLNTPPRYDSSNFIGLLSATGVQWAPPGILSIAVGLGAAVVLGRSSRTSQSFLLAIAFALAASFLVTSQAFANYWFLVFGVCCVTMMRLMDRTDAEHGA